MGDREIVVYIYLSVERVLPREVNIIYYLYVICTLLKEILSGVSIEMVPT